MRVLSRMFLLYISTALYLKLLLSVFLVLAGLSKVAGCRRKLQPTWLVSAGYSPWHFLTDRVF